MDEAHGTDRFPAERMWARLIICAGLGAGVVLFAVVGWPYVRFPVLLTAVNAVTDVFADAATQGLLGREDEPDAGGGHISGFRPPLCAPPDLPTDAAVRGECEVARPQYVKSCRNEKGCAEITMDPSILADPQLFDVVRAAIRNPCDVLTPRDPAPASKAMHMPRVVDRRVLRCGSTFEVHGRVEAPAPHGNVLRVRF